MTRVFFAKEVNFYNRRKFYFTIWFSCYGFLSGLSRDNRISIQIQGLLFERIIGGVSRTVFRKDKLVRCFHSSTFIRAEVFMGVFLRINGPVVFQKLAVDISAVSEFFFGISKELDLEVFHGLWIFVLPFLSLMM